MNIRLTLLGMAAMMGASCAVAAAPDDAAKSDTAKAGDRCEAAVAETVRRMRGREAREVEFIGAKRAIAPTGDEEETGVRGEGRYGAGAGSMAFTYSCAFNTRTGATSGVMFRETGSARARSDAAGEPDLMNVSPDACETAAASALKDKYPRVGRIAFGSDTRQLRPAPNARTSLEGQGALQRAPGMSSVPFRYRCEFDNRNGKVLSVQTTD